jgi:nicotinate phosphoribosyltransferase
MAHSFIQAHDSEVEAFERFARSHPDNATLLIDTYDTEAAARKLVQLAPRLARDGIRVRAVRLDSGDLAEHARQVRSILDAGGLGEVKIFASSGLDETAVQRLLAVENAPIDGFGIGSNLDTSHDAPSLDCAYKLQEYAGNARRKRSEGKATWPGRKQVLRRYTDAGHMAGDLLMLEEEAADGEPLLRPALRNGLRVQGFGGLSQARERCRRDLERLPPALRALEPAAAHPVQVSDGLQRLAAEVDRRQAAAAD